MHDKREAVEGKIEMVHFKTPNCVTVLYRKVSLHASRNSIIVRHIATVNNITLLFLDRQCQLKVPLVSTGRLFFYTDFNYQ